MPYSHSHVKKPFFQKQGKQHIQHLEDLKKHQEIKLNSYASYRFHFTKYQSVRSNEILGAIFLLLIVSGRTHKEITKANSSEKTRNK